MTFSKHQLVNYRRSNHPTPERAQILEVHHNGDQPYYTIKCVNDPHERQTDLQHLSNIPRKLFNKDYFKKTRRLFSHWTSKNAPYECDFQPKPTYDKTPPSMSDLETIDLDEESQTTSYSSEFSF